LLYIPRHDEQNVSRVTGIVNPNNAFTGFNARYCLSAHVVACNKIQCNMTE
jgi:hypothetical protein